uniref:Uncharacterized protein n=1 Tax=Glossina austeni TaxID=7395 RepID=A0A1A9UHS1_GLOAU
MFQVYLDYTCPTEEFLFSVTLTINVSYVIRQCESDPNRSLDNLTFAKELCNHNTLLVVMVVVVGIKCSPLDEYNILRLEVGDRHTFVKFYTKIHNNEKHWLYHLKFVGL